MSVSSVADGGQPELELSDDPYDGRRLEMESAPVLVTLTRIGGGTASGPSLGILMYAFFLPHLREPLRG